jgi:hypothetical protein
MNHPKPDPSSAAPYGTLPRRPAWPLVGLLALFAVWFGFLVWMAVRFPAPR